MLTLILSLFLSGNIWIIGDGTCQDIALLNQEAADDCSPMKMQPIILDETGPCLATAWGIFGPYLVPGLHSMTFECE